MLTLLVAGSLAHAAPGAEITPGEVTFLAMDMSQGKTFSLQVHDGSQSWYTDCAYHSDAETLSCDDLPKLDVVTLIALDDAVVFALDADGWHDWVSGARIGSEDGASEECSSIELSSIYSFIRNNQDAVNDWMGGPYGPSDQDLELMCLDQYTSDLRDCDNSLDCLFEAYASLAACLSDI
jgi:hypothetical protein